jgi:hypothetical protein
MPEGSFYLISIPNFFRSLEMVSFFNSKEADSARKSNTPLFSLKSPNSPLAFLEVEELKHLSSISLTSTLESVLTKDLVRFSISCFCLPTSRYISSFLFSINHSISPVLYFCVWIMFCCWVSMARVLNSFSLSSTTRCSSLSLAA